MVTPSSVMSVKDIPALASIALSYAQLDWISSNFLFPLLHAHPVLHICCLQAGVAGRAERPDTQPFCSCEASWTNRKTAALWSSLDPRINHRFLSPACAVSLHFMFWHFVVCVFFFFSNLWKMFQRKMFFERFRFRVSLSLSPLLPFTDMIALSTVW